MRTNKTRIKKCRIRLCQISANRRFMTFWCATPRPRREPDRHLSLVTSLPLLRQVTCGPRYAPRALDVGRLRAGDVSRRSNVCASDVRARLALVCPRLMLRADLAGVQGSVFPYISPADCCRTTVYLRTSRMARRLLAVSWAMRIWRIMASALWLLRGKRVNLLVGERHCDIMSAADSSCS